MSGAKGAYDERTQSHPYFPAYGKHWSNRPGFEGCCSFCQQGNVNADDDCEYWVDISVRPERPERPPMYVSQLQSETEQ